MRYEIQFKKSAWETLQALEPNIRGRLKEAILELADNPVPAGAVRLRGDLPFCRIRVGSYRVIYEVRHAVFVVLVLKIGHRRDVYRQL